MKRVYISGGIKNVPDFVERFQRGADEVARWAVPVNPVDIGACRETPGPCAYPGELLDTGHTWQCYMRHDIERLVHCDAIYMLLGWERSKGASEELRIAQGLGLTVHFQQANDRTSGVLQDVAAERQAQQAQWGEQNHPDGTGPQRDALVEGGPTSLWVADSNADLVDLATRRCQVEHDAGTGTWEHILTEEWAEALAAADPVELRHELVQVAAVAVAWVEAIDRRTS